VTLRNTFYINELFGTFCYKQLKSMNILLLSGCFKKDGEIPKARTEND
jgi:hypothetical protein